MAEEKWKFFEKTLAKYPDRVYSVEENKIPYWGMRKRKARTTERKTYDGTVQCNRYELRRLPDPCRKSRVKGTRCHILRSQPSDKFHGRGGNGLPGRDYCRRGKCRLRCVEKRREGKHITVGFHSRIRRDAERQGNTGHETPSGEFRFSFDSAHVFLHGPYDVGMAAAEIL